MIYKAIYAYEDAHEEIYELPINSAYNCRPNKIAYPDCCDYEFVKILNECGVDLLFSKYIACRLKEDEKYYGEILDYNNGE